MNRIDTLFKEKKQNILSIYFTAGHPTLSSSSKIIKSLVKAKVDMIEIGIPFSDPIADGPVIQESCHSSLENGMSLKLLFEELENIRKEVTIPLILMGSLNPVLQYGIDNFARKCSETGIDGTIIPDLPLDIFQEEFKPVYDEFGLYNVFLATPQTSNKRYRTLDRESAGFLYMVSASATTGAREGFEEYQEKYFERIKNLDLHLPRLIGFGISSHDTFKHACQYASGAIIGSAFVKLLEESGDLESDIPEFIKSILNG